MTDERQGLASTTWPQPFLILILYLYFLFSSSLSSDLGDFIMPAYQGTTARLRRTFHYPEEDSTDSQPEALDEQGTP